MWHALNKDQPTPVSAALFYERTETTKSMTGPPPLWRSKMAKHPKKVEIAGQYGIQYTASLMGHGEEN